MFYESGEHFQWDIAKRLCLIGMSGIGKTHMANILRKEQWYHYSVDYRIGTEYMRESINTELRRLAMQTPRLARLLRMDSVTIKCKFGFDNLDALTAYLGQPGNETLGGLPLNEYKRRLCEHEAAERLATSDYGPHMKNSKYIYGYDHFVCDSSGSLCHVVDPSNADDPILTDLASRCLIVHLKSSEEQRGRLLETYRLNPKPIYYPPRLLDKLWREFGEVSGAATSEIDPADFAPWGFERIIGLRQDLYDSIAAQWGYTIDAEDLHRINTGAEFLELIASAIDTDPEPSISVKLHRFSNNLEPALSA